MKFKYLFILQLFFAPICLAAPALTYTSANNKIISIEKELAPCVVAPMEAAQCYEDALEKYDQLIKDIRKQNSKKIDQKLWYSINLGVKNQINSCRDSNLISGTRNFFYPFQDCETNLTHSLAVTAIELHLK